jgi:hypothetical protein
MPEVHGSGWPLPPPISERYPDTSGNYIPTRTNYMKMDNWRPMDTENDKSMPGKNSLYQDVSGNLIYDPYF